MLCDEHGLFLEIAQAIRRLELTVLKGVMETRSNNLWAHFVVEVYFCDAALCEIYLKLISPF